MVIFFMQGQMLLKPVFHAVEYRYMSTMLLTWSTAFAERISTYCALMVRYIHATYIVYTLYVHCMSVYTPCIYILTDGLQVRKSRAYLDSLSMDGAEVAVNYLCSVRS